MNSVAKMADLVADPAAFETLQGGLQKLYKLPLQHLRLIRADDPTKINISTRYCNIDGNALADRLRARGIEPEMSDRIHVICMATVGDTAAGFHLLARALTEIDRTLSPGDVAGDAAALTAPAPAKLAGARRGAVTIPTGSGAYCLRDGVCLSARGADDRAR